MAEALEKRYFRLQMYACKLTVHPPGPWISSENSVSVSISDRLPDLFVWLPNTTPYVSLPSPRPNVFDSVISCQLDESMAKVTERIARHEVHRLVVVDSEDKVIGIVSLSDLLKYLVFRPSSSSTSNAAASIMSGSPSRRELGSLSRPRRQSEAIPEVSDEC